MQLSSRTEGQPAPPPKHRETIIQENQTILVDHWVAYRYPYSGESKRERERERERENTRDGEREGERMRGMERGRSRDSQKERERTT